MNSAEQLIENAIYAMKDGVSVEKELDSLHNMLLLNKTGISKNNIIAMARHVVYSLYDGKFPDG